MPRHLEVARLLADALSARGPAYVAAEEPGLGAALRRRLPWFRRPCAPTYRPPSGESATLRATRELGIMALRVEVRHAVTSDADEEALTAQHLEGLLRLLEVVTHDPFSAPDSLVTD